MSNKAIIGIVVGIIILIVIISALPFTIVSTGERAIVLRFGGVVRVLGEGIHYKTPFVESIETIDIRVQKEQVEATAASKDLQSVTATVALNYGLQAESVGLLFSHIGREYKTRIIDPAIQEAVKAATAKYTAEELVTKRDSVRNDIRNALVDRLVKDYIVVDDVSIVDFEFSPGFRQAIEAKVTAEQNALQAKNKLAQIEFEAQQKIATAEAEAKSIRLQSDAANNDKYIALKRLDVQLEFAKRWNGVLPVNLYGSAPIPFLDVK